MSKSASDIESGTIGLTVMIIEAEALLDVDITGATKINRSGKS
jgi:hypothetical protein